MQVICEASVFSDPQVRASAIECLVQIASLYYEILAPYIQTIFNVRKKNFQTIYSSQLFLFRSQSNQSKTDLMRSLYKELNFGQLFAMKKFISFKKQKKHKKKEELLKNNVVFL